MLPCRYEEDDTFVAGAGNSIVVRHTSATPLPPMPSQLGGLKGRPSGLQLSFKRCVARDAPCHVAFLTCACMEHQHALVWRKGQRRMWSAHESFQEFSINITFCQKECEY